MASNDIGRSRPDSESVVPEEKMSMHEGIANWCDCCVCEAEPYWMDVADEMGINMSDYEDGR
ncbi:hypothetical protein [Photobacterium rosenbergii]|uniref:Uncharacterized protein n=1 Tax=Photobacterium rosenbergii TaxID=294936 RepID=A0ABU3ZG25_9GAMM|nr:hypothetical protein [Photobacterium rosenbergii]MDV5169046.1 hypothetical protein [Photobacterium rosenbergii]